MIHQPKRHRRIGPLGAASLALIACPGTAQAQCMYEVVVITGVECAPGEFSGFGGGAIDEDGNISGAVACGIASTAAVWTGEITLPLSGPPGMGETNAFGLSDPDHIVGEAIPAGDNFALPAYWEFGQGTLLELPVDANTGFACGINRSGQIVGGVNDFIDGPKQAVLWDNGQVQVLQLPLSQAAHALDINESGQITGWMEFNSTSGNGFIWHNGVITTLPILSGGQSSRGTVINRFGRVAGWGRVPTGEPPSDDPHAFFWDGSTMIDLGTLPGKDSSIARDINDVDQIVGESSFGGSSNRAFLWRNGGMQQLQDIVVDDLGGFNLISARAIDNQGWILAYNGEISLVLRPIGSNLADIDNNCIVDINDFLLVIAEWGQANSFADTNDDGIVGIDDFLNVLANWG